MRLYLIRHGQTDFNKARRYCGRADVPMNEEGRARVRRLAGTVRRISPDAVYTSTSGRAIETAKILFPRARPIRAGALVELDFGRWEGLTYEEVSARYRRLYERWIKDPFSAEPPGGESLGALEERVIAFLGYLIRRKAARRVALVAHYGPLRAVLYHLLEDDREGFWARKIDAPSVSCLELKGGRVVAHYVNRR